jgi:AraC-like DNA-binding protein
MDALSALLRSVRLVGAIFIEARFTAPWCYESPPAHQAAALLEPGAERVVIFHLIPHGECWLELAGASPTRLRAGDAVLLPHGDGHRLASAQGLAPAPIDMHRLLARRPRQLQFGGDGAATGVLCGYLACDDLLARLLFTGLPRAVRANVRGSNAGQWLESSMHYALAETHGARPGGAGVLAKLAEVLVIELLRLYMEQQPAGSTGWLAGVGDRIVGAALQALHNDPARAWTLEELARCAATSRSVLAARFQQVVGSSPIQYLAQWRMVLAANLLAGSNAPLARIAQDVGYQTDSAFSRAFRREFGTPPAAWRRSRGLRAAGPTGPASA